MKTTRRFVQFGFLALTLLGVFAFGANCERWCPFGGVEAAYTYAREGNMLCSLGVSNFYVLGGVLLITILLRRAFCGYACPIGTLSEWLSSLGRRLGIPTVRVPHVLDRALALLKYAVLVVILWLTWRAGELIFRGFDPCYALISRHGTDITFWAYVSAGTIAAVSLVMMLPFCRWLCPLAAVLNPLSRFGLTRIKRNAEGCRDCGLCSQNCPMAIPVHQLPEVRAARCTSCMNCVAACAGKESGVIGWGPPRLLGNRWPQAALVAVLLLCTAGAVTACYLFPVPSFVKTSPGPPPAQVVTVRLKINDLGCRGRANLLVFFLERDDEYMLQGPDPDRPGYYKIEAWPGPGLVDVHVSYDPAWNDETAIKRAATEWYYNALDGLWWESPFVIEGYDPLDFGIGDQL